MGLCGVYELGRGPIVNRQCKFVTLIHADLVLGRVSRF